jgi:putative intracellular protease/amidase
MPFSRSELFLSKEPNLPGKTMRRGYQRMPIGHATEGFEFSLGSAKKMFVNVTMAKRHCFQRRDKMKKISLFAIIVILSGIISCSPHAFGQGSSKVLMIIREGHSHDPDLMIKMEVGTMMALLKKAGFGVDVTSLSGQDVSGCSQKIEKLLKLSQVKVDDYVGAIIPCMGVGLSESIASPEVVTTVNNFLTKGKVVAASNGGVFVLGKAGGLKGREFAFYTGPSDPQFKSWFDTTDLEGATYSGTGVVQDGKVITGGACPSTEANAGLQNKTLEVTQTFIAAIDSKHPPAHSQGGKMKLAGTWRLISFQQVRFADEVQPDEWLGKKPTGLIVYDTNGYVSAQYMRDPQEKGFDRYYAWFGTYKTEEKDGPEGMEGIVEHHVQGSSMVGQEHVGLIKRSLFKISGDRLVFTTGADRRATYERVENRK